MTYAFLLIKTWMWLLLYIIGSVIQKQQNPFIITWKDLRICSRNEGTKKNV